MEAAATGPVPATNTVEHATPPSGAALSFVTQAMMSTLLLGSKNAVYRQTLCTVEPSELSRLIVM